jgi:Protein of unknown function (DUF3251)
MRRFVLICLSASLVSCAQPMPPPPGQAEAIQVLKNQVAALIKRLDEDDVKLSGQSSLISQLVAWRYSHDYSSVQLDPAQRGYGRVDADVGTFAVSLQDVRPFADSVRVRLTVGNLSAATFSGAKLTLKYGRRMPNGSEPDYGAALNAWSASLQTKLESITERLLPGHWNPVQVTLPGIQPKDLGYLEVSISTDQIFMYTQ